jgi:hypothetical protein
LLVPFPFTNEYPESLKVHILHAQLKAFVQAEAGPVENSSDEAVDATKKPYDCHRLPVCEHDGKPPGTFSANILSDIG